ncbi:MAG: hypothetical protein LIO92_00775 [Clostridiales bacterium]|nr:hypothetical protein [Clostridiales bacterium]
MLQNVMIWTQEKANDIGSMIELLNSTEKENAIRRLKTNDAKWGFDLEREYSFRNRYDNDDYIFVADMLEDVRNIHKTIYYNPYEKTWIRDNREIPYIHLEFYEQLIATKGDNGELLKDENDVYILDDKKINMGVKPPLKNGTHVLTFNYYWLQRYLVFLQKIFDCNEELVLQIPETVSHEPHYGTKEDILKLISNLNRLGLKAQAQSLRLYLNSSYDPQYILIPDLCFLESLNEKQQIVWGFPSNEKHSVSIPLKKGIYNTSGFAALFSERTTLISELFINSLKMVLAHEVAHVARGHWNLRIKEPEYSQQRNVMMNCEIQADHTAMRWLLNELLYDTVDGNPYSPILAYTRETLIKLWAIRIFSAYLSLSWGFREDDRVWDIQTIEEFRAKRDATHPIYQFRLFCVLNHAMDHLNHMANECRKAPLLTADNTRIDDNLFDAVLKKALDMIYSFEASFRVDWNEDERTTIQKLSDSLRIEKQSQPKDIKDVPFMIGYMNQAKKELEEYERQWPEILSKLKEYGMYFVC